MNTWSNIPPVEYEVSLDELRAFPIPTNLNKKQESTPDIPTKPVYICKKCNKQVLKTGTGTAMCPDCSHWWYESDIDTATAIKKEYVPIDPPESTKKEEKEGPVSPFKVISRIIEDKVIELFDDYCFDRQLQELELEWTNNEYTSVVALVTNKADENTVAKFYIESDKQCFRLILGDFTPELYGMSPYALASSEKF